MKNNQNIYELGLHESTMIVCPGSPQVLVTRVASGWLYSYQTDASAVFVPFDNHFIQEATHD